MLEIEIKKQKQTNKQTKQNKINKTKQNKPTDTHPQSYTINGRARTPLIFNLQIFKLEPLEVVNYNSG